MPMTSSLSLDLGHSAAASWTVLSSASQQATSRSRALKPLLTCRVGAHGHDVKTSDHGSLKVKNNRLDNATFLMAKLSRRQQLVHGKLGMSLAALWAEQEVLELTKRNSACGREYEDGARELTIVEGPMAQSGGIFMVDSKLQVDPQKLDSSVHQLIAESFPPQFFPSQAMLLIALSIGSTALLTLISPDSALALGPEGPLMDEFWGNVSRFVLYFFTVLTGGLYSLLRPIGDAVKNPSTAILITIVLGGGFFLMYLALSAMLGLDGYTYDYDF